MANISFTVTMTDNTTMGVVASVADGDVARLLNWAGATFSQKYDTEGNPLDRTPQNLTSQWIEGVVSETMSKIHKFEQQVASKAAADAIQPISVTIE